ncbi:MAG: hypothetical protein J1E85_10690 [Ruminococcus sp.]|nr:hypothetical protein [Ruminococcus sp.]
MEKKQKEKIRLNIEAINFNELNNIVGNIKKQASELQKAISQLEEFKLEITVKN